MDLSERRLEHCYSILSLCLAAIHNLFLIYHVEAYVYTFKINQRKAFVKTGAKADEERLSNRYILEILRSVPRQVIYGRLQSFFWFGEIIFLLWNSINDPLFGYLLDKNVLIGHLQSKHEIIFTKIRKIQYFGPCLGKETISNSSILTLPQPL